MHSLKAFHSPNAYTKDNRAHGINRVGADHTTQLCNRSNNKNNKHVLKKKKMLSQPPLEPALCSGPAPP